MSDPTGGVTQGPSILDNIENTALGDSGSIASAEAKINKMIDESDGSQEGLIAMQLEVGKYTNMITAFTNMISNMNDTNRSVINNF